MTPQIGHGTPGEAAAKIGMYLPRTRQFIVKTSVISFMFNPVASIEGNKQNIWLWIWTIWLYQQDTVRPVSNYRWNAECSLWNPGGLVGGYTSPLCSRAAQIPDCQAPCQSLWPSQIMSVKHFPLLSCALTAQQTHRITIDEKTMCKYRQWQLCLKVYRLERETSRAALGPLIIPEHQ